MLIKTYAKRHLLSEHGGPEPQPIFYIAFLLKKGKYFDLAKSFPLPLERKVISTECETYLNPYNSVLVEIYKHGLANKNNIHWYAVPFFYSVQAYQAAVESKGFKAVLQETIQDMSATDEVCSTEQCAEGVLIAAAGCHHVPPMLKHKALQQALVLGRSVLSRYANHCEAYGTLGDAYYALADGGDAAAQYARADEQYALALHYAKDVGVAWLQRIRLRRKEYAVFNKTKLQEELVAQAIAYAGRPVSGIAASSSSALVALALPSVANNQMFDSEPSASLQIALTLEQKATAWEAEVVEMLAKARANYSGFAEEVALWTSGMSKISEIFFAISPSFKSTLEVP